MRDSLNVAVVGLNFGERWLPAYLADPGVASVANCDPARPVLDRVADRSASANVMPASRTCLPPVISTQSIW